LLPLLFLLLLLLLLFPLLFLPLLLLVLVLAPVGVTTQARGVPPLEEVKKKSEQEKASV
jgi:hypothetical protein